MPSLDPLILKSVLPRHIAVIMDGNGRWAQHRQLSRLEGHQAGLQAAHRLIKCCVESNIQVLTLFAFSSENWQRPSQEVQGLLTLLLQALQKELDGLIQHNIRLRIIGCVSQFNAHLQYEIHKAEQDTAQNTGLVLVIAVAYGGKWDIVQAAKQLLTQALSNGSPVEDITPEQFANYLQLSDLPMPDLCIRTGGEYRLSNFLLWQLAYSELYFTPVLWPDFGEPAFNEELKFYAGRERRFGLTHEQIT